MKLSQPAFSMAHLVLKHNKMKENPTQKPTSKEPIQRQTKYSLDYSAFERIADDDCQKTKNIKKNVEDAGLTQFAHLHDKSKERELFEKSTKEKLENISYFKDKGNEAYCVKEYDKAAYMYQKAILYFDYTFADTADQEKKIKELQQKCHMNMALCLYQLKRSDEALCSLRQVLLVNPKNTKALFRQAMIAYDRDQFQECSRKIKQTEEAFNGLKNVELQELRERFQIKQREYDSKIRKVTAKMF